MKGIGTCALRGGRLGVLVRMHERRCSDEQDGEEGRWQGLAHGVSFKNTNPESLSKRGSAALCPKAWITFRAIGR
jgi:hypothetical protein